MSEWNEAIEAAAKLAHDVSHKERKNRESYDADDERSQVLCMQAAMTALEIAIAIRALKKPLMNNHPLGVTVTPRSAS